MIYDVLDTLWAGCRLVGRSRVSVVSPRGKSQAIYRSVGNVLTLSPSRFSRRSGTRSEQNGDSSGELGYMYSTRSVSQHGVYMYAVSDKTLGYRWSRTSPYTAVGG
jgi:hypothetical protein